MICLTLVQTQCGIFLGQWGIFATPGHQLHLWFGPTVWLFGEWWEL